jgi:hypothetical protein
MAILRGAGWAGAALVCGLLSGCASTGYENTKHPDYGATQNDADLAQCRKQNSQVITHSAYAEVTEVKVDEPAVQACMTTLGWQPAKS